MSGSNPPASDWRTLDGVPLDGDEPVFEEPWQAQAFAIAVKLNQRGVFSWNEWARTLGASIAAAPKTSYWNHWMTALEAMLARHEIADSNTVETRTRQWHEAAARTPHGEPIELDG